MQGLVPNANLQWRWGLSARDVLSLVSNSQPFPAARMGSEACVGLPAKTHELEQWRRRARRSRSGASTIVGRACQQGTVGPVRLLGCPRNRPGTSSHQVLQAGASCAIAYSSERSHAVSVLSWASVLSWGEKENHNTHRILWARQPRGN